MEPSSSAPIVAAPSSLHSQPRLVELQIRERSFGLNYRQRDLHRMRSDCVRQFFLRLRKDIGRKRFGRDPFYYEDHVIGGESDLSLVAVPMVPVPRKNLPSL